MNRKITSSLAALLAILFFGFAFAAAETASEGTVAKVTTVKGTLNLRAKPSLQSTVNAEIPNGACLLVLEEDESWCLCQWQGKTGYCVKDYLTLLREADLSLLDYRVLAPGDQGDDVLMLKERLQELGYIRAGSELNSNYNDILRERIALFQRQIGATEDGIASQELQAYLYSDRAPQCTQTLPRARSQVHTVSNGMNRVICGCCMGDGCECCNFTGWIYY